MRDLDSDNFLGLLMSNSGNPAPQWHTPVMTKQVLAALRPAPGMLFLDCTAGGGGHSSILLEAGASVIALDQDPEALEQSRKRLSGYGDRVRFVQANFRDAVRVLDEMGETRPLNGVLLDIGVSSHQLDDPARGFSLLRSGPLDMRMGPAAGMTAAEAVNMLPEAELARIFSEYGEEPRARAIAKNLCKLRASQPFETTTQLGEAVESVSPRRGPRHPATQVFQALRIHVNDELGALREALQTIPTRMAPGARMAVITFHSLEDRIVKVFLRTHSQEWLDRPEWPEPRPNPDRIFKLLTTHPLAPSPGEVARNPRARSAKMRVAEKIQEDSL
jgi:16S rRNA (cytosine1402-N4)-methyltransferase